MKTIKKAILSLAMIFGAITVAQAQMIPNGYFNADWQVNIPVGNDFVSKTTGWGMNFEGGSYLGMSDFALGGFFSYHTNNEYISARVLSVGDNGSVYTDQVHSLFQLPFGLSGRYRLTSGEGILDPYISLKLGAQYAKFTSDYSAFETWDKNWGFYLSPEIGTVIYPSAEHYFGLHLSAYFSYATNKIDLMSVSVKSMNNFGIRVGLSF